MRKALLIRVLISMLLGLAAAVLISELAFRLLGNTTSRPPEEIELIIPPGTAEKVAQGERVMPEEISFVVGDTLIVVNEDNVAHTLGPLYIPAGASSSLKLDQPTNMSYSCSFQPSQDFGVSVEGLGNVDEALTPGTRIYGILIAGIPMGALFAVYSLVLWPLRRAAID